MQGKDGFVDFLVRHLILYARGLTLTIFCARLFPFAEEKSIFRCFEWFVVVQLRF